LLEVASATSQKEKCNVQQSAFDPVPKFFSDWRSGGRPSCWRKSAGGGVQSTWSERVAAQATAKPVDVNCRVVGAISHRCYTFHSDATWREGLSDYFGSNGR
jgi:hypothetical protein